MSELKDLQKKHEAKIEELAFLAGSMGVWKDYEEWKGCERKRLEVIEEYCGCCGVNAPLPESKVCKDCS